MHLIRYHGVLAPDARVRAQLVTKPRACAPSADDEPEARVSRTAMTSMPRLTRVYDIDISVCPRCGGSVKVLAVLTDPAVTASILAHLAKRAARGPPAVA